LFANDDGCVDFYEGEVRAFLRLEEMEWERKQKMKI
jgi:hypothetical protein